MRNPLFIDHRITLTSLAFVANVAVRGRILLEETTADGFWMFGVNPGGINASGRTMEDAYNVFCSRYRSTLLDLAERSSTFDLFKAQVEALLNDTNEEYERLWQEARQQVRAGRSNVPELPRVTEDSTFSVAVTRLASSSPVHSVSEEVSLALARAA